MRPRKIFSKHFCFNGVSSKSIKISAMVDSWINIEDEAGMLDCEIDEVVEGKMNDRPDDGGDGDSEGGECENIRLIYKQDPYVPSMGSSFGLKRLA